MPTPHVRRAERRRRCARCGHTRTYVDTSAKQANSWFARHDCHKREDAMVRAAGYKLRLDLIDRTPKELPPGKVHGYAGYRIFGCRCDVCGKARSEYDTNRDRMIAYGRWGARWVDAEPVRAHVAELRDFGLGLRGICTLSGVSRTALQKLTNGRSLRVTRVNAEALYAVELVEDNLPRSAIVPATGTTRRLQALVAIGYTMTSIGAEIGWTLTNLGPLVHGHRPFVVVNTKRLVGEVYERLCMTLPADTPGSRRARALAKANRWQPPLAWDDDVIDDPKGKPTRATAANLGYDEAVVVRFVDYWERPDRKLSHAEAEEIVRRLTVRGVSMREMEANGLRADRYDLSDLKDDRRSA